MPQDPVFLKVACFFFFLCRFGVPGRRSMIDVVDCIILASLALPDLAGKGNFGAIFRGVQKDGQEVCVQTGWRAPRPTTRHQRSTKWYSSRTSGAGCWTSPVNRLLQAVPTSSFSQTQWEKVAQKTFPQTLTAVLNASPVLLAKKLGGALTHLAANGSPAGSAASFRH